VKNTSDRGKDLHDLTVFNVDSTQSMSFIRRGQDVSFAAHEVKKFDDIKFKPDHIEASTLTDPNDIHTSVQTTIFQLNATPDQGSWLVNPGTTPKAPLFLQIEPSQANPIPPAEGSILDFTNGLNPNTPGWLVGTGMDNSNGNVTNPYTGQAQVFSNAFAFSFPLAPVPEPSAFVAAIIGAFGVIGYGCLRPRSERALRG
jgi:hypothetical protein